MAYNRYQYETSPRKLQPEYVPIKKKYPKKSTAKKIDVKSNQRKQTSWAMRKRTHCPRTRNVVKFSPVCGVMTAKGNAHLKRRKSFQSKGKSTETIRFQCFLVEISGIEPLTS